MGCIDVREISLVSVQPGYHFFLAFAHRLMLPYRSSVAFARRPDVHYQILASNCTSIWSCNIFSAVSGQNGRTTDAHMPMWIINLDLSKVFDKNT